MYTLTTQVYLDRCSQQYKNIITINQIPEGPLRPFVRRIRFPPLISRTMDSNSNYDEQYKSCGFALSSFTGKPWMTPDEIPDLFSFLYSNGYHIDTSITKMMNTGEVRLNNRNILCFFSYQQKKLIS